MARLIPARCGKPYVPSDGHFLMQFATLDAGFTWFTWFTIDRDFRESKMKSCMRVKSLRRLSRGNTGTLDRFPASETTFDNDC